MALGDTAKASWITDHAFEPRIKPSFGTYGPIPTYHPFPLAWNEYLCKHCRLAEAAHRDTTIERNP